MNPLAARIVRAQLLGNLLEGFTPLALALGTGGIYFWLISTPQPSHPATPGEQAILVCGLGAMGGWAAGRTTYLLGWRQPWRAFGVGMVVVALLVAILHLLIPLQFARLCKSAGGAPATGTTDLCVRSGQILRAGGGGIDRRWWPVLLFSGLCATGMRHRRLWPDRLAPRLLRELPLVQAAGTRSSPGALTMGTPRVAACENRTLWGEPCGQLYPMEMATQLTGCGRCHLRFSPSPLCRIRVVSLSTVDPGQLSAWENESERQLGRWEHKDAGVEFVEATRPYRSRHERWVELGELSLPSVLTVAQTLALILEWLESREEPADTRVRDASKLALARASGLVAWRWELPERRERGWGTYARPEDRARLLRGTQRLRDVAMEQLTLQLDVGVLPLQLLYTVEEGMKQDADIPQDVPVRHMKSTFVWLPVCVDNPGHLWVPRVEGRALQRWLREEHRTSHKDGIILRNLLPAILPKTTVTSENFRNLDYTIVSGKDQTLDQLRQATATGLRISEWVWFDPEMIERLRDDMLCLTGDVRRWS